MTKQKGWIVKHEKYGTWFISREAVVKDYKTYLKEFNDPIPDIVPDRDIETWFHEQVSWVEVHYYGKQLERPDMEAWEMYFMKQMKKDTNYLTDEGEVG